MISNDMLNFDLHFVPNITYLEDKKDVTLVDNGSMRILYMNCRSLNCKFEEIQNLLTSTNSIPNILAFDETWIRESSIKYFQLNGFIPFMTGRSFRRGGGVGIFVRKGWGTPRVLEKFVEDLIEGIVVEVKLGHETCIFIVVYRPPLSLNLDRQQQYLDRLEDILSKHSCNRIFMLGDHNIDILRENESFTQNYMNVLLQFNKVIYNKGFVTRPISNACLDHIILDYELVGKAKVQALKFMNLDHLVMFIDIQLEMREMTTEPLYIVKKFLDYERFKSTLPSRLAYINDTFSVDCLFENINKVLKDTKDECSFVKVFKRKTNFKSDWMDDELIRTIDTKEYWYKKKTFEPTDEFYQNQYKYWRNKVTSMKRTKRKENFKRKFERCEGDKKKIWNCMKLSRTNGQKVHNDTNLLSTLQTKEEKQMKIDEFNNFYSRIGDNFRKTSLDIPLHVPIRTILDKNFNFQELTLEETRNIIMSLKNKNSSGYDGISPVLLKFCCDEISPYVKTLINKSLSTGVFPTYAKIARVIGIYKSGKSEDVGNFRPISVTPVLGKVIELSVDIQLSKYLEENNILCVEQYGFRRKSNTMTTCFDLVNSVCKNRDDGNITCLTFIDTQKAFNSVNRNILAMKLKNIGCKNITLKWFESFLHDNRQYSECAEFKSEIRYVNTGLMQGSILSPKLFNIYSCDLPMMNFEGKLYCYADDLCFEHTGTEIGLIEETANNDMIKFENYMNFNHLTVNIGKTKFMTIGHANDSISIKYAGQFLENVVEFKYLGLTITKSLDWNLHVKKLYRNLSSLAGVFRKISNVIPNELKKTLYNSMFVSHLLYCLPIYGATTNANIILLQRCQNRALKNLYEKDMLYSPIRLLNELDLLSCINFYRLFSISHIHSIKIKEIHSNTRLMSRNHDYETRNRNNLWKHNIHTRTWGPL